MNELIPLHSQTIDGNAVETVNARELHAFLEVQTRFNDWIKNRIEKYEFVENQDFLVVTEKNVAEKSMTYDNWQGRIEYHITLDMAKELSMVERTEKGRQARRYFIECSNKADKILKSLAYLEYQPKTELLHLKDGKYVTDSLVLANLVNKHHYHVLRDIELEIEELEENPNLDSPIKESILKGFSSGSYRSVQNKELPKYILSEEATLQVLLKYSSEVRARFIVAFKEAREALNNIVKLKEIEKLLPEVSTNSSFVYIVKNMDTNNIKIGVSKDVYKRLETFRTGNDCQLELVYKSIICSNTFDLESKVHEEFKDFHVRGEWFRVSESKVIEYLEKARYILKGSVIDVSGNGMFKTDGEMAEL